MSAKNELQTFINKYKSEKGKPYTNTSIGNPKFSVNVPPDNYDEFLNLYALAITNGVHLYLTEKPLDPSPIRIDLDFRFSQDLNTEGEAKPLVRKYNDTIITKITLHYFSDYKIMESYFKILNTYLTFIRNSKICI